MAFSNQAVVKQPLSSGSTHCVYCGRWPATLYKDISHKGNTPRVCEMCVEEGSVIRVDGIYVPNPARLPEPAEPAE